MSLKTYVVAIAMKINHFRNKEGYILHDIVTTQINIDASFRTPLMCLKYSKLL